MGRYCLRLTEIEFWRLTLAQFVALAERYRDERERSDYRAALVASVVANTARDPAKKPEPYKPSDFMPQHAPERQTWRQQLAIVEVWNRALGGRDLRGGRGKHVHGPA